MKTRWMKKSLSLLLALVLCLSVLSPAALAAEDVVLPEEQSEPAPDTRIDAQPEASAPVPAEPEAQPAAEGEGDGESPDAAAEDAAAPSDAGEPGEEAEPSEAPALEEPETQPEEPEALPEEGEADEVLPEETDEDAEETGEPVELRSFSLSYVNPLYADVVSEADLPTPRDPEHYRTALRDSMGKKAAAEEEPITYCQTVEEAGAQVRSQLVARNAEIAVYYRLPADDDMNALLHAIFDTALAHTGNPREGDYLEYQYGGWNVSVSYAYADETTYNCSIVYSVLYYTSAAQESEMDGRVNAILGQLDLGGKSDQQKLEAIYAYLCANVVYDFDNLNNDEYKLKYTGYAALCNGTAVCQGISVAFYRLCLASGVDARVVDCDDMCHAWNIARCHGAYYALDATWDLGAESPVNYWYFLKGSTYWLSSHKVGSVSSLGDQYQDAAFASLYAIPAEDCNLEALETYYIHYDPNGGENAPADQVKEQGIPLRLSTDVPTRDGYDFQGWALSTEAAGPDYLPGANFNIDASVILYAVWADPSSYTSGTCGADGGNLTWTLTDGKTLTIRGTGEMAGCDPLSSRMPWAPQADQIETVVMEDGVTSIGEFAFWGGQNITSVTIPTSVVRIGESAFRGCGSLPRITIPKSVTSIGKEAFFGCYILQEICFEHEKNDPLAFVDSQIFGVGLTDERLATNVYIPDADPSFINETISAYNWDSDGRDVTFISTLNWYQATYILNGGTNSPANPERYSSLDAVSLAAPTREGYAFAGWYASEDFSGDPVAVLSGGVPAAVYAKWSPIVYSIHFDPNGGSGTIRDLHGCETDARYPLPESGFTRTGYTLAGWNTAPDGSGAAYLPGEEIVNLCSVPDGSVTLYAVWTPNSYTIAFDGNGADGEAMAPMETLFGRNTALPPCTLTRTGYHFTGWNTRVDGKGTAYADGAAVLSLTAEAGGVVTLYAQWSPNAYTVRFDPNGGTGSMAAQPMTYDKEAALRANAFKKASNVFLGWATEPDALSPLYLDKQKISNLTAARDGALTLYAVWAKYSYQIVFNANGGSGDMADDGGFCEYDGVYTLPACGFTREGFDFLGWATSAKGKVVYQDGQSISGLSNKNGAVIKLYAVWQAHSYRVAFDGNGAGSGSMKVLSCTCGKTYTLTANAFKRTGYTFAGWNTAPDGSGATYANKAKQMNFATDNGALLTLYAQWTPTAYKITYKNIVAGDGNPNPETYTVESETIVLAPAFRPGCDFAGWFADAKFKTPVTEIAAGGTGARTLYAKWIGTANTYGIVFDPNGGTGTTKAMAKLSCGKAYALTANAFKRAGYIFAGWNTAPDGSGTAYTNKEKVANLSVEDGGSVTLFAQWTPVVYKITYKNALYDGNTNPATFTPESETIVLAPVSRAGCVFGGWFTDAKFKTPITEIATGRVGNLTLYAKWTGKAATYTIAFDGNGASSGKMKDMTKRACGSAYALTANAFKRTGYSFAGWNTAPDSSGAAYANKEKVANLCEIDGGTATLYAQWTPIAYTISYKNIGPALTPEKTSYTVEEGFELPTPVKVGHVFLGWYSTAAFKPGTQVRSIEPGTTGNLTLYAKWMLLRG